MADSNLSDLSIDFAVKVLKLCEQIEGHYSLVNQLERSATSIGANIREAQFAHGKADFISKLQIALKECSETRYWLELLYEAGYIDSKSYQSIYADCDELMKILSASTKTIKAEQSE